MTEPVKLRLYRGSEARRSAPLDLEISVPRGATLLDALVQLREKQGIDVAFDYACVTNNSCKLCALRINGTPTYACTYLLSCGTTYTVEPVDIRRPHKDLFTLRRDVW